MADQTPANAGTPIERANAWYLLFLERESLAAGRPANASDLGEHLQLAPVGGKTAQDGAPIPLAVYSRLSTCSIRLNATTGETISWYLDFLALGCDASMPPADAVALATQVAEPPANAVLDESGYDIMAGRSFFRARWKHVLDGIPVEGDYIEVLINGKHRKVFSLSKVWRDPRVGAPPQSL
ncbi:MAG: hypothetical protein ABI564_12555 [Ideonella sp.]